MVVNVDDSTWQSQLTTMRSQILDRMEQVLGRRIVTDVQFRIVPPRPGVKRDESAALAIDEADGISHPMLRTIYRSSKRRASGE